MDEKSQPQATARPSPRFVGSKSKPWSRRWLALVVTAAAIVWTTWHWPLHEHGCPGRQAEQLRRYKGEKIDWRPCGSVGGRDAECGDIDVPMDQFNATNSGDKTFNIPLMRVRGRNATQNILLNPGGPGGSGLEFLAGQGEQIHDVVGEDFHLLSFDPRGVFKSKPMGSCYPDEDTRVQYEDVKRNTEVLHGSGERFAWTSNYVQACADNMGEHGKYINTPQTAADMNSILDAVGQQDMVYWGFSYGTLLGQTYATLFPERSHRVIIDGVVNQFEWYGSRIQEEDYVDTDKVIDGIFDECIKAGDRCALSSFATTGHELRAKVFDSIDGLKENPVPAYVNTTLYGVVDHSSMFVNGLLGVAYSPKRWPKFTADVAALMNGNVTDAFLGYARSMPFKLSVDALFFVLLNDGLSGSEYWSQDKNDLLNEVLPLYEKYPWAVASNIMYYRRQQWKVPKTHAYVPRRNVTTAHPLLILSATYDPVCPLVSARSARDAFEGSKIVELRAYGHCSLAMPSECVNQHVRDYLNDGTMPSDETACEISGRYFDETEEEDAYALVAGWR